MKKEKLIFLLESIHQVLKAEKALQKADLPFDIIPVPKEINPECGMALETDPKERQRISEALTRSNIKIKSVYRRRGKTFLKTAEEPDC
ncbi:MAG: DUF3343 domain-containing protein [Deltaproteobacteria bacterium]|nr:DUF3343 domain-containing protein [Deltaproteobacteria bacterium]MBW2052048.1 DUF3343 domain-containing protein [Deltaproteobacteria bacterium]